MKIDFSQIVTAEAKKEAEAREAATAAARAYLTETDWYIVRRMETGASVPREIGTARQAAREVLSPEN